MKILYYIQNMVTKLWSFEVWNTKGIFWELRQKDEAHQNWRWKKVDHRCSLRSNSSTRPTNISERYKSKSIGASFEDSNDCNTRRRHSVKFDELGSTSRWLRTSNVCCCHRSRISNHLLKLDNVSEVVQLKHHCWKQNKKLDLTTWFFQMPISICNYPRFTCWYWMIVQILWT